MEHAADFESLYQRYAPDVLRFVLYMTRRPDWAGDILAETFLRAWTTRETIRMATAKGLLIAIARNLILDRQRRAGRDAELDESAHAAPSARLDQRILLDQTLAAIAQLPDHRAPLVLHAISEIPHKETS